MNSEHRISALVVVARATLIGAGAYAMAATKWTPASPGAIVIGLLLFGGSVNPPATRLQWPEHARTRAFLLAALAGLIMAGVMRGFFPELRSMSSGWALASALLVHQASAWHSWIRVVRMLRPLTTLAALGFIALESCMPGLSIVRIG